jgi:hypothetical protein
MQRIVVDRGKESTMSEINPGNSERTDAPRPLYTGEERRSARRREEDRATKITVEAVEGGSLIESVGGAAAIVLAVVGLADVLPVWMAGVATIVVGAALISHGGAVAARWRDLLDHLGGGGDTRVALGGATGAELLGGAAAIVLAVLALTGTRTIELLSIAAIVLGGTLLFGSPTPSELAKLDAHASPRVRALTTRAADASSGVMTLAGIAVAILGILALTEVRDALTLSLVATLIVGAAVLLSGGAVAARLAPRLWHR